MQQDVRSSPASPTTTVYRVPGGSSWAGEHRGKTAIESFLRRFLEAGLVGEVHDIVVNGPPSRPPYACSSPTEPEPGGEVVYENRVMFLVRAVWGKVVSQEDFLDTEKVATFNRYLYAG